LPLAFVTASRPQATTWPGATCSVRHLVKWKAGTDCHLLQARPVRLKFYLNNAKLYSLTLRILHNHYL